MAGFFGQFDPQNASKWVVRTGGRVLLRRIDLVAEFLEVLEFVEEGAGPSTLLPSTDSG
jgi:hypothetical protein